ncbi:aspartate dehydrogenase [Pseudooceanicola spongiae]|uniref:L-aspartate dehydrogenase n=1 Tax=Pseudooceanicola spongiae TaxID=2613965 RepID=A0A7L9WP87_9RHOB|nr:aspartate dehydrogenase [Pseudooceanicola spongiae]QOL81328.1 aspartate dehydrogenase [Pseudooceanicola spongiae]
MHLGLIGYGNIATLLPRILGQQGALPSRIDVLVRPGRADAARAAFGETVVTVHEDTATFIASAPALVVEAATHMAVKTSVLECLRAGLPVLIVSVGALADATLEAAVRDAAEAGHTQAHLSSGAVGGIDMLAAARLSGITSVAYTSRKPPMAWRGTPAEDLLDLASLTEATTFYQGTARAAATDYPKNANVAATIALAGAGFEATEVRMVADPAVSANIHEFTLRSGALDFTVTLEGKPSPENPKTSLSTVYALARTVLNQTALITV